MRFFPALVASAKGDPWDRSASDETIYANTVRAPGSGTLDTYTVPPNRIALATSISLQMTRYTAPAVLGFSGMWVNVKAARYQLSTFVAVVGDREWFAVPLSTYLEPGDTVSIQYQDLSTGGMIWYTGTCGITEFDP